MLRKKLIWLSMLMATSAMVSAQIGNGLGTGRMGTFNTYSASVMGAGFLSTYNQGRLFAVAGQSGFGTIKNVNLYHASNNFTAAYGFMDNFDALVSIITYQDINIRTVRGSQSLVPGDLYLSIRTGSYQIGEGSLEYGGSVTGRFPTGGQHNIPFEVYRSKNIEFGVMGLLSYYSNPYYKDQSYSLNLNLGFWSHNDNGTVVTPSDDPNYSKAESDVNALALQYGLGLQIPVSKVHFMLDLYGLNYLTAPTKYVFSRESFAYSSFGLRYNLRSWLNVGTFFDLQLAGKSDKTSYDGVGKLYGVTKPGQPANSSSKGAPNYNTWRFGFGLGFNILPATFGNSGGAVGGEQRRKKLLDRLMEEEKGAQRASNQLDKLKNIRVNAEKELEQIRLELEGGQ